MTFKNTILLILMLVVQLCASNKLYAQKGGGDVIVKEMALSKDAIFKPDSTVEYEFEMQNNFNRTQQGKLSYLIKTPHGVFIAQSSMPVKLNANTTQTVTLRMPGQKPGFYKVSFSINLNDYDDTIRRVFGVGINMIKSTHPKPADFNLFWKTTKTQLAQIPAHYQVTEKPELAQADYRVYQVEMKSLGNITIRGWLTMPKDKLPQEKLPVYLVLPGYGAELSPIPGVPHFACLALDVRGLGNSRDVIAPAKDDFITYGIQNKTQYILRGVIMDCERMLDFIVSNNDFDPKAICVTGGSMGAYLSYVLAGLDSRVALVIADNPTFSDWRWAVGDGAFPMTNIEKYAKSHGLPMASVLKTLDYFDLKNFMSTVKAKSIMAIGLLDNFAPPNTELVAYNNLVGDKQMFIYSNLGHEIDQSLGNFKGKWLYTNFNMYNRVVALANGSVYVEPAATTTAAITKTIPRRSPVSKRGRITPKKKVETTTGDNNTYATNNPPPPAPTPAIEKEEVAKDNPDNGAKFNSNPVGFAAHAGSKSSIFKRNSTIYYDVDLKNNTSVLQKGTLTCAVTTKTGDHISITTAAVRMASQTAQKFRMNLPLQKGGYFKATFILNLSTFKDTIIRDFGVDVDNMGTSTETGEKGKIGITLHAGAKDAVFNSKNIAYYTFDLKNNFDIQQNGNLGFEIRTMDDKFVSLTSIAVRLPPNAVTSDVRINLPTQKSGQYKGNIIIKTYGYRDTVKTNFSVDADPVKQTNHTSEDETISLIEHPGNKDATFKSKSNIYYNLDLKNNFSTQQSGRVACQISTMDDKILSLTSLAVTLQGKASKQVKMNLPTQSVGFYKVAFIINTPDYDDTVRRVMGVDIYDIHSPHPAPTNFHEFWSAAKEELVKVDPKFKMIEKPELSRGNDQVYLIEMQSIGNLTVRGWLTLPKDRRANQKFPVYLALPGYGADQKPFHDMPDFAAIALNVRGQGNSNDVLSIGREDFLTYNILDKNKYILRGAIMDCVRAVDFIFSRPEFDSKSIYSNGGSMGGYFSLILASLDHRITVCTAGNPAFSDWRTLVDHNDFPMGSIQRYARENGLSLNRILDNLDYFDLKNFVGDIKCKTLVGVGLLDNLAPPHTELPAYNNIQSTKKIFIFPNLGHQVGDTFGSYTGKMVYDNFGIF
jgi:cephalosporin-C deacetylase-like acetyl esterase